MIGWIAGIVDGEGTFATNGGKIKSPCFCVMMKCKKSIDTFARFLDSFGYVSYEYSVREPRKPGHSTMYVIRIRKIQSLIWFCSVMSSHLITKRAQCLHVLEWSLGKTTWKRGVGQNEKFHYELKGKNHEASC